MHSFNWIVLANRFLLIKRICSNDWLVNNSYASFVIHNELNSSSSIEREREKKKISIEENVVRVLTKASQFNCHLTISTTRREDMCTERALIQCDIHTRSIKLRIMMAYSYLFCLAHRHGRKSKSILQETRWRREEKKMNTFDIESIN